MSGISRIFFAASASLLRGLAWVPFIAADRINALASWCEGQAAEQKPSRGQP